jgi:hypothetical protein
MLLLTEMVISGNLRQAGQILYNAWCTVTERIRNNDWLKLGLD